MLVEALVTISESTIIPGISRRERIPVVSAHSNVNQNKDSRRKTYHVFHTARVASSKSLDSPIRLKAVMLTVYVSSRLYGMLFYKPLDMLTSLF